MRFIALKVTHEGRTRYYEDIADVFAAIDIHAPDKGWISWWYSTDIGSYENDRLRVERVTAAQMVAALNERESA